MIVQSSNSGAALPVRTSKHAAIRQQQRGIHRDEITFVYENADREEHAGRGCFKLSISRRHARKLAREGWPPQFVTNASRVALIESGSGVIVTVFHTH